MRASRVSSGALAPNIAEFRVDHPNFWNPQYYLPFTMIRPKQSGLVPFRLMSHQVHLARAVYSCLQHGKWLCHLKARREGATTLLVGVLMQHIMFSEGKVGGILSHKKGNALDTLVAMCDRNWKSLPPDVRPYRPAGQVKTLEFPELDSQIMVDSAWSNDPFRGQTLHMLLADEISSYPESRSDDVWAAVLSAVPSPQEGGMVFAASTPKRFGDAMHTLGESAKKPNSPWHYLFLPWFLNEEYQRKPPPRWACPPEIQDYANKYHLTPEQAYWIEAEGLPKCAGKLQKFIAEYPADDVACYNRSGEAVFNPQVLLDQYLLLPQDIATGTVVEEELEVYEEPIAGHCYLLALDPASSFAEADYWGLVVMDLTTGRQVVDFLGHRHAAQMAALVDGLSRKYNGCRCYIESNGVGDAVLSHLTPPTRNLGTRLYKRFSDGKFQPGWLSNARTKAIAEGYLQDIIDTRSWTFRSRRALKQLMGYRGGWGRAARDDLGGHYDLVGALAIAAWAFQQDRHTLGRLGGETITVQAEEEEVDLLAAATAHLLRHGRLPQPASSNATVFGVHR